MKKMEGKKYVFGGILSHQDDFYFNRIKYLNKEARKIFDIYLSYFKLTVMKKICSIM